MTCPSCSAYNHEDAPFCVECGATMSLNNDENGDFAASAERVLPAPRLALPPRPALPPVRALMSPRRWSMEVRIVLALLLLLGGFQFMVNQGVAADSTAYDVARVAMKGQQWHAAVKQLAPLANKGFRDASEQLAQAQQVVSDFDSKWQTALKESATGEHIKALNDFQQAASIEPAYSGLNDRIAAERAALGQIVYRIPASASDAGGLWLADIDGGNSVQLPGGDAHAALMAIDGDGDRFLYVNVAPAPQGSSKREVNFYLYSIREHGAQEFSIALSNTLGLSTADLLTGYQAAFFAGGVVISEGGFGSSSDAPNGFRVWTFDHAGTLHQFQTWLVARPALDSEVLYMTSVSDAGSKIVSYYPPPDQRSVIQAVSKTITHLYEVNGELLYSTYEQSEMAIYLLDPIQRIPRRLLVAANTSNDIIYGSQSLWLQPSPNGQIAFLTMPNSQNYILNLDDGRLYGLSNLPAQGRCNVRFVSFSPDGQHLLLSGTIFYTAMSPMSEGPRYDWVGVSDLNGNVTYQTFGGSVDAGGFLDASTLYYYRTYGGDGPTNNTEVVISPVGGIKDAKPISGFNLQGDSWSPYPISRIDNSGALLAGRVGNRNGIFIRDTGFAVRMSIPATSVWLLKAGQVSPAGLP